MWACYFCHDLSNPSFELPLVSNWKKNYIVTVILSKKYLLWFLFTYVEFNHFSTWRNDFEIRVLACDRYKTGLLDPNHPLLISLSLMAIQITYRWWQYRYVHICLYSAKPLLIQWYTDITMAEMKNNNIFIWHGSLFTTYRFSFNLILQ